MAQIVVTSDELSSLSTQLTSGAADIDSRVKSMQGQVQNLVDSNWQGAASTQFQALYKQWNDGATELQGALQGISKLLASAATAYAETEQQIQQSMNT